MSNQQCAEPEWQDSQQRSIHTDPREPQAGNSPAVNVDPREKIQPQPAPRWRKSKLWLWILIALIVGALAGSGIDEIFHTFQHRSIETHTYQVNSLPTLIIHDNTGSITIHRGGDHSHITITTTKYAPVYSNIPTVEFFQNGNTITANERGGGFLGFSNADFEVTVPSNTNLQIHSDTGEIHVNGVNGAMSLTTNTGSITADQDILNRQSVLHSDTGSVTFSGSLTPNGHYEMSSDTGSVDVTLPSKAAFHIDATTNTGTFSSSFLGLNAQPFNGIGSVVHGNVGNTPRANLTLKTNTGAIDIHWG